MQSHLKKLQYAFTLCFIFSVGCFTVESKCKLVSENPLAPKHAYRCNCCSGNIAEPITEPAVESVTEPMPELTLESAPELASITSELESTYEFANIYAVLISAGVAQKGVMLASEYWDDLVLQYKMLIMNGFPEENIYVLYDRGHDFDSVFWHSITNRPVTKKDIGEVFDELSDLIKENDLLYVWWMGHGSKSDTCKLTLPISGTTEEFTDEELNECINRVSHYKKRAIAVMTCYSEGIIDNMDVEDNRTVTLTSSACQENSYSIYSDCDDLFHAEFNYELTNALCQQDPCGRNVPSDAIGNGDGHISLLEVHEYNTMAMMESTPQMGDHDRISCSTHLQ